ncbi:MAG: proline dehydrogenase family protein [Bacteroidota bacterium]|nr:proline dehydrogenase family protein [Bacteroidota bacterium]
MVSFDNTEIAFSGKSDADLRRSFWLFRMIGSPTFVKIGKAMTTFALNLHLPIKGMIKATIFKQFVGGETIEECNRTVEVLGKFRIGTILDYSVEGKESEMDFDACCAETIATVERAKNDLHIPFCVFKVTGLARFALLEKVSAREKLSVEEASEFKRIHQRVEKICSTAHQHGKPIFIDAEESWIQHAIDELADDMMLKLNKEKAIVYNTFQLYRKDRLGFLRKSLERAKQHNYILGAKLVRGAYMEKERARAEKMNYPSPIQDTKENTDRDYDAALHFCVGHIDRIAVCAGTHNESSSLLLVKALEEKNIVHDHPHIFFSQLLGMSDHISFNLASDNYNVAKYVPYGPVKEVLPYLIRRAQENTSVKGQTGRELSLIIKEKKRRRN